MTEKSFEKVFLMEKRNVWNEGPPPYQGKAKQCVGDPLSFVLWNPFVWMIMVLCLETPGAPRLKTPGDKISKILFGLFKLTPQADAWLGSAFYFF